MTTSNTTHNILRLLRFS